MTDPELSYAYGRYLFKEYGSDSLFEAFDSAVADVSIDNPIQHQLLWLYAHAYQGDEPEKAIYYFEKFLFFYV